MIPEILKKLGFRPFYFWVIYVFIGITMARKPIKKIHPIFIFSPIFIGVELLYLRKYNFEHFGYITLGTILFSTLFCAFFIQKNTFTYSKKIHTLIGFVGQNTLIIFISNPLIIILFNNAIKHCDFGNAALQNQPWVNILLSLITVIIVFIATLIITKILHKTNLNKVLG